MICIIEGKPVHVPDDATVTPELKALRAALNDPRGHLQQMLAATKKDVDEDGPISRAYRQGVMSETDGFDWYLDPTRGK